MGRNVKKPLRLVKFPLGNLKAANVTLKEYLPDSKEALSRHGAGTLWRYHIGYNCCNREADVIHATLVTRVKSGTRYCKTCGGAAAKAEIKSEKAIDPNAPPRIVPPTWPLPPSLRGLYAESPHR